jgi:predicted metal-binding membrane protein
VPASALAPSNPLVAAEQHLRAHLVRRPESWLYVVAASAAVAMLLPLVAGDAASAHAHHHGTHHEGGSWLADWRHWDLMVLAMMVPVAAPYARRVAFESLWRRRHRAIAWFVLGYLALWLAVGAALVGAVAVVGRTPDLRLVSLLFLLAAAWQVSRPRRRVLRRCGVLPAGALKGWRADRDCTVNGLRYGVRCTLVCGPAMAAAALSGSLVLMAGVIVLFLSERARGPNPHRRAGRPLEAWGLATFAAVALIA